MWPVLVSALHPIEQLQRIALVGLAVAAFGCIGSPSPLAPQQRGSVGLPHRGTLTVAQRLPARGPGFRRLRHDAMAWGNPRLVDAIVRAAAAVERQLPGGQPLVVGDLSARRGGKIPHHHSHRSGRDADLLYFALSPDGRPVPSPGFVRFARDGFATAPGRGHRQVQLDVARTWLLVKALASDPQAQVMWLFTSRWLEALLIEHALARGEAPTLVWHAELLLHQPSDSFPHDDHLHLRIACSPDEVAHGCQTGGYRWPWLPPERPKPLNDRTLVALLLDEPAPPAASALVPGLAPPSGVP